MCPQREVVLDFIDDCDGDQDYERDETETEIESTNNIETQPNDLYGCKNLTNYLSSSIAKSECSKVSYKNISNFIHCDEYSTIYVNIEKSNQNAPVVLSNEHKEIIKHSQMFLTDTELTVIAVADDLNKKSKHHLLSDCESWSFMHILTLMPMIKKVNRSIAGQYLSIEKETQSLWTLFYNDHTFPIDGNWLNLHKSNTISVPDKFYNKSVGFPFINGLTSRPSYLQITVQKDYSHIVVPNNNKKRSRPLINQYTIKQNSYDGFFNCLIQVVQYLQRN